MPVLYSDQHLAAVFGGAHNDQDAQSIPLKSNMEIDPVSPDIDVPFLAQVALGPCLLFLLPALFELHDIRRAEPHGGGSPYRR